MAARSSRRDCLRSCEYSPVRHADFRQRSSPSAVFGPPRAPCIRQTLKPRTAGFRHGSLSCFRCALQRGASRIRSGSIGRPPCRNRPKRPVTLLQVPVTLCIGTIAQFRNSVRVCATNVRRHSEKVVSGNRVFLALSETVAGPSAFGAAFRDRAAVSANTCKHRVSAAILRPTFGTSRA